MNGNGKPRRKQPLSKPITTGKSEQGEIKTYTLSDEELAYYRNLKPPVPVKQLRTTGYQDRRRVNLRSEGK